MKILLGKHSLSLSVCLFFFSFAAYTQGSDSLQLLKFWDVKATNFYVDALENIYLLNASNNLVRVEADGSTRFEFNDRKLGNLGVLDLSDPLDMFLFYPEFQELVVLDRTLSETGRINLNAFGFFGIEAVGYSTDNRIWLYDPMAGTLKKVDFDGQLILESQIIPPLVRRPLSPVRIREQDQRVYMYDPEVGILVFDVFGKYLEQIPWDADRSVQVEKEFLFGCKGGECLILETFSRKEWRFKIPGEKISKVWFRAGKLYVLSPKGLYLYKLK